MKVQSGRAAAISQLSLGSSCTCKAADLCELILREHLRSRMQCTGWAGRRGALKHGQQAVKSLPLFGEEIRCMHGMHASHLSTGQI